MSVIDSTTGKEYTSVDALMIEANNNYIKDFNAGMHEIALAMSKKGDCHFIARADTTLMLYGEQFDYTKKDFEGNYFITRHGDISLEAKKGSLIKVSSTEFDASIVVYEPGKKPRFDKYGKILPTKVTCGKYLFDFLDVDRVTADIGKLAMSEDLQMISKEDFERLLDGFGGDPPPKPVKSRSEPYKFVSGDPNDPTQLHKPNKRKPIRHAR